MLLLLPTGGRVLGHRCSSPAILLVRWTRTMAMPNNTSLVAQRFAAAGALCAGVAVGLYCTTSMRLHANPTITSKTDRAAQPFELLSSLSKSSSKPGESTFNAERTTVIFVLGGPGVGKGTQCAKLVQEFDFVHISAGDLLREERQRPNSPYSDLIDHYIKEGKIVPYEITISLLQTTMKTYSEEGKSRFLIDGFPRSIDQGIEFEAVVCPSKIVLFFECGEDEMLRRLLSRSQSSGRADDNIDSIKKRFRVFQESTIPVREFYQDLGKLRAINCVGSVEEVYDRTKNAIHELTNISFDRP